jgi:hypothetical protein
MVKKPVVNIVWELEKMSFVIRYLHVCRSLLAKKAYKHQSISNFQNLN